MLTRAILHSAIAASLAMLAFAWMLGVMPADAPARVAEALTPSSAAETPHCFGAVSRDVEKPCHNAALRLMVVPSPRAARTFTESPCEPTPDDAALDVCTFGVAADEAVGTIALLGDSHAMQLRAAVDVVAHAKRWRGYSLVLGGCPYSAATRTAVRGPLLSKCIERNRSVPDWFERHPEVRTVFVAQISGVTFNLSDRDQFAGQVNAYRRAWRALPDSVTRIVVIRDNPRARGMTSACIERAMARRDPAARACRVPRRVALKRDPAVTATRRAIPRKRVEVVDLTRYFCDARWCYPVIGGALVLSDTNHLTPLFASTLGTYLLADISGHPG